MTATLALSRCDNPFYTKRFGFYIPGGISWHTVGQVIQVDMVNLSPICGGGFHCNSLHQPTVSVLLEGGD